MINKVLINQYINRVCTTAFSDDMRDYFKKSIYDVLQLSDGLIGFDKPSIKKNFCFSYDEYQDAQCGTDTYSEALHNANNVQYNYFEHENTKDLYNKIETLKDENIKKYIINKYHRGTDDIKGLFVERWQNCEAIKRDYPEARELTEEEKEAFIAKYEEIIETVKKRCVTWWKKYGQEKLHTWTYSRWD